MSFCLHFVTKRYFDCEQVKQQTSQTELKHVSFVRLSEVTPLIILRPVQSSRLSVPSRSKLTALQLKVLPV